MNKDWEEYLKKKFPKVVPDRFILDLSEIDFYLSPIHGVDTESFRAIQKHNQKVKIF